MITSTSVDEYEPFEELCAPYLYPYRQRWKPGGGRGCKRDAGFDGAARRGDREGRTQPGVDGRQVPAAKQTDPEKGDQEDAELQDGVGVVGSKHGHAQLLPGEQEGD